MPELAQTCVEGLGKTWQDGGVFALLLEPVGVAGWRAKSPPEVMVPKKRRSPFDVEMSASTSRLGRMTNVHTPEEASFPLTVPSKRRSDISTSSNAVEGAGSKTSRAPVEEQPASATLTIETTFQFTICMVSNEQLACPCSTGGALV